MTRGRRAVFSTGDRANIRWFWNGYLREKAWGLFIVLVLVSAQGLVYQQFLSLTENGLRVIFDSAAVADLIRVCGIVFLLFVIRGALSYIVPRLSAILVGDAMAKLRRDVIDHLLQLDLQYFERTKASDLILRLVRQVDAIGLFVSQTLVGAVRDAVTVVIVAGYLILKSPILFLAAVLVIPAIILLMQVVAHHIRDIQSNTETAMGDYMNGIEEMSNGMRTVKISGQEDRERGRLFAATQNLRDLTVRLQTAQALIMPSIDMVSAFVYVLVIGGGGYMVIDGGYGIDAATMFAFLLGLVILFDPARRLAQFTSQLLATAVLLDSLRSVLRERPGITDRPDAKDAFDATGDITFRGVRFGYDAERSLFDGLDLDLPGGKTTAIVGATGSGKTTILSLVTRLYDVADGAVAIGGTDIRDLRVKALRSAFSVVAQDIVIFNASIWDNIRYVRPQATEAEIWAAAEAAEIAELIRSRGDAPLGPKGNQLSGGQKQRIAIARAILQDAPILLLDEATSALDQRTETRVKDALERAAKGRTTVVVAHRLSMVTDADWIYVLDAGRVAEQGTHADLMARDGLYAAMYRSQKTGYR